MLDSLLSMIAPFECLECGAEGSLLCEACFTEAYDALPSRCYRCHQATTHFATCPSCRHESPLLQVFPAFSFSDQHIKDLVYECKFHHARAATETMAAMMRLQIPYIGKDTIVVPVPTATKRVRQRGFDHAALTAKAYAAQEGLLFMPALVRIGQTRQVGASKKQRHEQLQGAFRVVSPKRIKAEHILLLDDVLTTGATLEAAARVLKQAGAKTVSAAVFAQKFTT